MSETRTCQHCGETFGPRTRESANKFARRKYCGQDCAHNSRSLIPAADVPCTGRPGSLWPNCKCARCYKRKCAALKARRLGKVAKADVAGAWRLLEQMAEAGLPYRTISEIVGINHRTIQRVMRRWRNTGVQQRFTAPTVAKILAHQNPAEWIGFHVSALGASRRLQALAAIGYTTSMLADENLPESSLNSIRAGRQQQVRSSTDAAIRGLFDRLSLTPAPDSVSSRRALRYARVYGWFPPAAWDDIDDPDEQPQLSTDGPSGVDEAAVYRRMAGDRRIKLNRAETVLLVETMTGRGVSEKQIEEITGVNAHRVKTWKRKADAPEGDMDRAGFPGYCRTAGHELVGDNIVWVKGRGGETWRSCRLCRNARAKESKRRRRAREKLEAAA